MAREAWAAEQERALEGVKLKAQEELVLASSKQQKQKEYLKLLNFSRRSLHLRMKQREAHKRQLKQQAEEQPVEKRARQANASPVMQYDGPDVECEVSLEQDPVATDFGAVETQQVDTFPLKIKTFSGFFLLNNKSK